MKAAVLPAGIPGNPSMHEEVWPGVSEARWGDEPSNLDGVERAWPTPNGNLRQRMTLGIGDGSMNSNASCRTRGGPALAHSGPEPAAPVHAEGSGGRVAGFPGDCCRRGSGAGQSRLVRATQHRKRCGTLGPNGKVARRRNRRTSDAGSKAGGEDDPGQHRSPESIGPARSPRLPRRP
jgi:hypothetical protein